MPPSNIPPSMVSPNSGHVPATIAMASPNVPMAKAPAQMYQQQPLNMANPFADFGRMEPFTKVANVQQTPIVQKTEYGPPYNSIQPFLEYTVNIPSVPPKYINGLDELNKPYERPFISDKPSKDFQFFIYQKENLQLKCPLIGVP